PTLDKRWRLHSQRPTDDGALRYPSERDTKSRTDPVRRRRYHRASLPLVACSRTRCLDLSADHLAGFGIHAPLVGESQGDAWKTHPLGGVGQSFVPGNDPRLPAVGLGDEGTAQTAGLSAIPRDHRLALAKPHRSTAR